MTEPGPATDARLEPPPAAPRRLSLRRMARLGLAFACVPTVMAFAARLWWVCDLGSHFAAQSAAATLVLLIVLSACRDRRAAAVAAVVLGINVVRIAPLSLPENVPPVDSRGPTLRLLSANVHTSNTDAAAFLDLVRREDPDVLLVLEANARWGRALSGLAATYPHSAQDLREDNFGLAFFTRLPGSIEIVELADSVVPTVVARLAHADATVTVIGTHPLPPTSGENTGLRDRQLAAIARLAAAESGPVIVAGDLNNTSWSPSFRDLLRNGSLRDTRRGFGLQTTWPTTSPLLRIPIDHVLVSRHFAVRSRRIGNDIGSDHLPVLVDLSLAE